MLLEKVSIQISCIADGTGQYLEVMSSDMVSLNVVVMAKEFVVYDERESTSSRPDAP